MSFEQLIRVAEEKEKLAARQLAEATQATTKQVQQLTLLQEYRLDYLRQLSERGKSGLGAASYSQLQQFLTRLDTLVIQQEYRLSQHRKAEEERRQQWLDLRQRHEALVWLMKQREQQALRKREKLEQKAADEWVVQQWARRAVSE